MSDFLWRQELQHARLPCPSLSLGVCPNSCPLSQWCYLPISSSAIPFSSCPQSFPASRSFPISQLFLLGGQNIGASASVMLELQHQSLQWIFRIDFVWDWLVWSCCCPRDSQRVFSRTTIWKHQFFGTQPSLWSKSHVHTWLLDVPSGNTLYYAWNSRHLFYDVIEVCLYSSVFSQRLGRRGIASHFSKPGMWLFAISASEVAQSCLTLCDPVDCSLPGSSLHEILQARILEWVAISFSRGSSQPRDRTWVSRIAGRHFNRGATREAQLFAMLGVNFLFWYAWGALSVMTCITSLSWLSLVPSLSSLQVSAA